MKPLIMPQLSLNGTSKERLLEQQIAVLEGFRQLQVAMADAMPHGRDYQFRPQEYRMANEAWMDRFKAIQALYREIEQHALAISDA